MKLTFDRGKLEAKIAEQFEKDINDYLENDNFQCVCYFIEIEYGQKYEFNIIFYPETKEIYKEVECVCNNKDVKLIFNPGNHNPKAEILAQKIRDIIQYQIDKNNDKEHQLNIKDDYVSHL